MAADGRIEIDTRINTEGAEADIEKLQEKIEKAGDKTKEVGESLSKGVTAPLAAIGIGAMAMASDVQSAQGMMQAQLGLTADEAKNLGQVAKDVWTNGFGDSMEGVSEAITKVRQNMGKMDDGTLQTMTENALILSKTFDADVNDTTKTASTMMKNFGMDAQDAFDLMTVGFQQGGDFSGELLDTLNEYSPQFASMGMSAQDMLGILITGAQEGAFNLDKVGDAVKEFNIRAQDGSTTTQQGFEAIGMNAKQMGEAISGGGDKAKHAFDATIAGLAAMKDPVQQNIAGTNLFGTQWEDVRSKVITAMGDGRTQIEGFQGSTKKAGEALNQSFSQQLQTVMRGIASSLQPLGEILLKMATDALPAFSQHMQFLTNLFNGLSPTVQQVIVVIGLIAAAIGPVVLIIGQVISVVSTLVGWFAPLVAFIAEAGGILPALGVAFTALTGPIGLIVMAVAALVGVFIWLWNTNEGFRVAVINIWNQIVAGFNIALKFIMNIVHSVLDDVITFATSMLNRLKEFWLNNGQMILNGVRAAFNAIWQTIQGVMYIIVGIFQAVWPLISGIVQIAWSLIKSIISVAINAVLGVISVAMNLLSGNWSGAWESIKRTVQNIWNDITNSFRNIDLGKIGSDIINGLVHGIQSAAGGIGKVISGIAASIPDGIKKLLGIASPSRVLRDEVGKWIPEGLALGINQNVDVVSRAAYSMGEKAVPTMPQGIMALNKAASTGQQTGGKGVNVNLYPQKAIVDEGDVLNAFTRVVTLYGL
jgi:phage-related minor tail protein